MFNLVSVLLKNGLSESDTPLYGHPLYRDTPLIRTLSIAPSVSVLTGFDCLDFQDLARGWGGGGVWVWSHNSRALSLSNIRSYGLVTFEGKANLTDFREK